jgi:hypothetical protein
MDAGPVERPAATPIRIVRHCAWLSCGRRTREEASTWSRFELELVCEFSWRAAGCWSRSRRQAGDDDEVDVNRLARFARRSLCALPGSCTQ